MHCHYIKFASKLNKVAQYYLIIKVRYDVLEHKSGGASLASLIRATSLRIIADKEYCYWIPRCKQNQANILRQTRRRIQHYKKITSNAMPEDYSLRRFL